MEPLIPPEDPSFERRSSDDPTFERRPSMSSEDSSSSAFRPSQSTSQLPNPSSSGDTSGAPHRATQSTSRLPFLPLNNGTQHIKPDLCEGNAKYNSYVTIYSKMAAPALAAMTQVIQAREEERGGKILRYRQERSNCVLLVKLTFRHLWWRETGWSTLPRLRLMLTGNQSKQQFLVQCWPTVSTRYNFYCQKGRLLFFLTLRDKILLDALERTQISIRLLAMRGRIWFWIFWRKKSINTGQKKCLWWGNQMDPLQVSKTFYHHNYYKCTWPWIYLPISRQDW